VEKIEWNVDGFSILGALYFPPDFEPGKRYPLVIQTHGFIPDEFSMDGHSEWSSGFAARPLAAKGVLVLQTWRLRDPSDYPRLSQDQELGATAEEAVLRFNALAYERAIDRLDEDGLIDRDRVGIVGFSRTSCFVGYTLTHSHYRFAAAMLIDGISCGYFEAIAQPEEARDIDFVNGGTSPFGSGLAAWIRNAPGFNLDKVHTPVGLLSLSDYSVLTAWEWYVGLSLQNKPVDFVLVPGGYHLGIKPSQRMLTEQALVDWFVFWLKGEKNPDPGKAEQNARWQELKHSKVEAGQ
jgi:dipeptidyl aminopeptidase/acylaminoacyl peptidase